MKNEQFIQLGRDEEIKKSNHYFGIELGNANGQNE